MSRKRKETEENSPGIADRVFGRDYEFKRNPKLSKLDATMVEVYRLNSS